MLGHVPSIACKAFSGLRYASPENDGDRQAASPRFSSSASGVGSRPRNSV